MKLSPLDIYNKEFKKSTFGYNVSEVNDFLDEVGMAYEKLLKEVNTLKDEKAKLEQQLETYEKMENKLEQTLELIRNSVEEEKERAQKEADNIKQRARMKAENIKEKAHKQVENEYKKIEELKEQKKLFEIRFKTLLESHLEMLDEEKKEHYNYEEDIAVSKSDDEETAELDE